MSYAGNLYPCAGKEHALELNKPIKIDLAAEGVLHGAYRVIVYAKVETGHNKEKSTGALVVSTTTYNGKIERKLHYRSYDQSSWSYNSENISLPISAGFTTEVDAENQGPAQEKYSASVQIVGYSK